MDSVEMLGLDDVERERQAARRAVDVKQAKAIAAEAIAIAADIDAALDRVGELLASRDAKLAACAGMSVAPADLATSLKHFAPVVAVAILNRLHQHVQPLLNNTLAEHQKKHRLAAVDRERLLRILMLE